MVTDIILKYQRGELLRSCIIGNSIGVGYRATGSLPESDILTGKLISSGTGTNKLQSQYRTASFAVDSWAQQLRTLLTTANASSVLDNQSGNGWDTNLHLGVGANSENIITILTAQSPKPDAAFIPLLVNDSRRQATIPFATFQSNLRSIVTSVINLGIVPILIAENSIYDEDDTPIPMSTYVAELAVIQSEYDAGVVGLIDCHTPFVTAVTAAGGWSQSGLYYDSIHPSQAGHDLIYAQIATELTTLLQAVKLNGAAVNYAPATADTTAQAVRFGVGSNTYYLVDAVATVSFGLPRRLKYYNGSEWVAGAVKSYNGSEWVEHELKATW